MESGGCEGGGVGGGRGERLMGGAMGGGTGARAAAFRLDAGDAVLDRRLHDGRADLALDAAGRSFKVDIGDLRHKLERGAAGLGETGTLPISACRPTRQYWPARGKFNHRAFESSCFA